MVTIGLEQIRKTKSWGRCGLLCNPASLDKNWVHAVDICQNLLGSQLVAIFSPQHGFEADVQDNMIESPDSKHKYTGLPIFSLYGDTRRPTKRMFDTIDTLLIDIQLVGCRVYTFKATIRECLLAAKEFGKQVVVLDRPNPLGGIAIEGRSLDADAESFVGPDILPMRHGLTPAEAARFFNRSIGADLSWIALEGWDPTQDFRATERNWVITSPNLPTLEGVFTYPGTVLFEGTNLSEGRGTGHPFLFIGAPYIGDSRKYVDLTKELFGDRPLGAVLRPASFIPTSGKWANEACYGMQIHVMHPEILKSYQLSLCLIKAAMVMGKGQFRWKQPPYEYEHTRLPIHLLTGSLKCEAKFEHFSVDDPFWNEGISAYIKAVKEYLIYPRQMRAVS